MRLILYIYKKSGKFTVDVFFKGTVLDKAELIHEVEEVLLKDDLKGARRLIYLDKKFTKSLKPGDKLMTSRNFYQLWDDKNLMKETDEDHIPNRYRRLIKKLAEEPEGKSTKLVVVPSPPESPREPVEKNSPETETELTYSKEILKVYEEMKLLFPEKAVLNQDHGSNNKREPENTMFNGKDLTENSPKKQDSVAQLSHIMNIYELTTESQNQTSGGLTVEMLDNIKMLKLVGFIPESGYRIVGDKLILDKPIGSACGDYITNRQGYSYYNRDGYQQRINRLSISDLV